MSLKTASDSIAEGQAKGSLPWTRGEMRKAVQEECGRLDQNSFNKCIDSMLGKIHQLKQHRGPLVGHTRAYTKPSHKKQMSIVVVLCEPEFSIKLKSHRMLVEPTTCPLLVFVELAALLTYLSQQNLQVHFCYAT